MTVDVRMAAKDYDALCVCASKARCSVSDVIRARLRRWIEQND